MFEFKENDTVLCPILSTQKRFHVFKNPISNGMFLFDDKQFAVAQQMLDDMTEHGKERSCPQAREIFFKNNLDRFAPICTTKNWFTLNGTRDVAFCDNIGYKSSKRNHYIPLVYPLNDTSLAFLTMMGIDIDLD